MHEAAKLSDYTKRRRGRAVWKNVLAVLICAVVFCTTYALILPAITKEGETFCGKEEHTHTEACYAAGDGAESTDTAPEPICGLEEAEAHTHTESCYLPAHTHTDACYTTPDPVLTCEIPEQHTHGADCYETTETCICGQAESAGHTHADGCFDAETGELVCDLAESEGHTHTDACYETSSTLICTIPEGHTHTDACYTVGEPTQTCDLEERTARELICTLEEGAGHTHTEACFPEADEASAEEPAEEPTCGLEEHTHTLICYSNPEADVETAAVWEKTFADVELTGNWAEDVLAIAKTQLGYQESTQNYDVTEDDKIKGYTRYGAWYGDPYGDWCAMFVSFCLHYAELDEAGMPLDANCEHWIQTLTEEEIYEKADGYTPKPGDLVFIDWNSDGKSEHIGLVAEVTGETDEAPTAIRTIEGNASDTVKYVDYKLTDAKLLGYGVLPENPEFLEATAVTAEQKTAKDNNLTPISSANTKDFVEINLYDYGTNINTLYNSNNKYPGFQQDNGTTSLSSLYLYGYNFGNNITADLAAGKSDVTNQGGDINKTTGADTFGNINVPISGAMKNILVDGYPALSDGTSLSYLFSQNTYATKKNTDNIDGLFKYDSETGAYSFNSRENHAQFNASTNTFTLYNQIITSNFIMYPFGNFLPFNDINTQCTQSSTINGDYIQTIASSAADKYKNGQDSAYNTLATVLTKFNELMTKQYKTDWTAADAANAYFTAAGIGKEFTNDDLTNIYSIDYDEATDFYFGMEIKMNFMQPKGGITGPNNNQNMVFYFTGDDDVWVYVDDVLFLDLSGIHRHVGGEIDFVNGEIKYYNLDKTTGDVATKPYKTVTFKEVLEAAGKKTDKKTDSLNEKGTFKDYTTHSFNFYYMERGAGSGVCRMNFNFPLLRKNTISVSKEVSSETLILGDPDYKFQILKVDEYGNKTNESFISAGTEYAIYSVTNSKEIGTQIGTGTTGENGVFTLKAGQRAEFTGISENSGKYYVRELLDETIAGQYGEIIVSGEVATKTDSGVTVGSETFIGVDSPIQDISNGATVFLFDNTVDEEKLGSLSIQKQLQPYPKERSTKTFDIAVTLDGKPLPVGTPYTVSDKTRTVQTEGIITIAADETAVISRILAGTTFTVQETTGSATGYTVTYTTPGGEFFADQDGKATGIIQLKNCVEMIVTNAEQGTSIVLPGTKALTAYDGTEHTYTFQLTEVTDQTGTTVKEGGLTQNVTATVANQKVDFQFQIDYGADSIQSSPTEFYYRITELPAEGILSNDTVYVVKVTVTKENGALSAECTGLWKNGESVSVPGSADFTNTLVGGLTLSKTVEGSDAAKQQDFTFTITLAPGKSGLDTLPTAYPAVHTDATDTQTPKTVEFTDGTTTVRLKHGETLAISGIPYGATWTITESDADGFRVTTTITAGEETTDGSGTATTGSITTADTAVAYQNTQGYQLPQTGGRGIQIYTMAGLVLTLCSAACLMYKYRRREAF